MDIDLVGVITFAAGLLTLFLGPVFGIWVLAIAAVFGAAAAIKFPAIGGASLPPAAVLALFFASSVALRPTMRNAALSSLNARSTGFWLLAFTVYAVLSALFFPRIFEGQTTVYSLARNGEQLGIVALSLTPRASNLTQAGYLIIDLLCFAAVAGFAMCVGTRAIRNAILAASAVLLAFAAADLLTHYTGTAELLSVIRNANYRMLESGEIAGVKRIVGSFPEASAYSYAALGFYAFALCLWLDGVWPRLTGAFATALALTLFLSTSTTAYIALAFFSGLILFRCSASLCRGRALKREAGYVLGALFLPLLLLWAAIVFPSLWSMADNLFDATIANKLNTQSGIERVKWNDHALRAFSDTFGIGAGVGSVRASSIVVALAANVGVLGLALFAVLIALVVRPMPFDGSIDVSVSRAAAGACTALAAAACVSAGSVDLGLPFFIFAALAAGAREWRFYSPAVSKGYPSSPHPWVVSTNVPVFK